MQDWIAQGEPREGFPIIHVVSDSLGKTGTDIAVAVAAAFDNMNPAIEILSEVTDADYLKQRLESHLELHRREASPMPFVLFYTLVEPAMRSTIKAFIENNDEVEGVDLLEASIDALRKTTGEEPVGRPGAFRELNDRYFKRIDAVEFTIAHDDGNRPYDLPLADIVLIGVSRSSKTPLSVYLSQLGYKVANIPLDPSTEPPKELAQVDTRRLFGLMTSPDLLVDIRKRRLKKAAGGTGVADSYADYENVCKDLEKSRALMRQLGCIVIRTDGKAIEESAQEILRYYSSFGLNVK